MDLIGALSLLLELSFVFELLGPAGAGAVVADNAVVVRAARAARLGARAGRFTRLVMKGVDLHTYVHSGRQIVYLTT